MKKLIVLLVLSSVAVSGCGLKGHWQSREIDPTVARDEYRPFGTVSPGGPFSRADVYLNEDQSYTADVYYGNEAVRSNGTWQKKDFKNEITFLPTTGSAYTYKYELKDFDSTLVLTREVQGTDVKWILKRQ